MIPPCDNAPVIAIDGPSGVGKGAVSAALADALGWHLLDSGAVYRAVALAADDRGVGPDDPAKLVALAAGLDLDFRAQGGGICVLIDGVSVDDRLRGETVSQMASKVAAIAEVRQALMALQRSFRQPPGLIADGRDMGTVVFPDAKLKIFLTASPEERANRRHKQLKEKGEDVILARLLSDIAERDRRDRERSVSPTVPADDAIVIDSTSMPLKAVIEQALSLVDAKALRQDSE
ncbi:MAG: (d)CMP kinase [Wenzhouxiangella sp.]|nr:(d)CMP kinase [Wenzhouxiangella sp.]MDR9453702.1 (d)CMP kinase [Wenzhouxiangella sp.]